ncbi:hydrogen peroxide-inducible genes activator [bacterium]|jgi:LysR family transcriptional regulator, hydrogen peroxide-inducible genes activator|nr:hydrogen peroxide-inducible genes activator [bacterium]
MNISTQGMRYVCALAKHLHFGKASVEEHTSQPNLSVQIKKIESELGIQIFERSNKRVLLTAKGRDVVLTFRMVLDKLVSLKSDLGESELNTIKIGIFPTLAPYILPKILPNIKQRFPNLVLYIVEEKTNDIIKQLATGQLDCVLAALPINDSTLSQSPLFRDPFYLAVSKEHSLSKRKHVTLDDLKQERILLLEEGHCLRDQALDVCFNDKLVVDTSYESTSLETLRAMVGSNNGITFMPKLCIDQNEMVSYIPFKEPFSRSIGIYWRKSSSHREFFEAFSACIRATFSLDKIES